MKCVNITEYAWWHGEIPGPVLNVAGAFAFFHRVWWLHQDWIKVCGGLRMGSFPQGPLGTWVHSWRAERLRRHYLNRTEPRLQATSDQI